MAAEGNYLARLRRLAMRADTAGKHQRALRLYRALLSYPGVGGLDWCRLGKVFEDLEDYDEALSAYRRALEVCSASDVVARSHAFSRLGRLLRLSGKLEQAEVASRRAVALAPRFVSKRVLLAGLLREMGFDQEAEDLLRGVIEEVPDHQDALYNLAAILWGQGHLPEAEKLLLRVIALDNECALAHLTLANVYRAQDRLELAEEHYRASLSIDPACMGSVAMCALGEVLGARGKEVAGRRLLRSAAKRFPGEALPATMLAADLAKAGEWEEATKWYLRALEVDAEDAKL